MEKVDIYDISSGAWYTQTTTGDPTITDSSANGFPKPRMIGCVVAASALDNTSHHIYMYGGGESYLSGSLEEVWVLSLPMFRWTRVFLHNLGLFGNTCHLAGNRYMLVVGGYRESGGCTEFLAIYDVSELQWVRNYYTNSAYYVPPEIANIVGGTPQGGATVTSPEAGWGSNVEAVFHSQTTGKPSPSTLTPTSPQPKPNIPAILGGVLGGLLGAAAVFFIIRQSLREDASRHHREPHSLPIADPGLGSPQHYDGGSTWNHPVQEIEAGIFRGGAEHRWDTGTWATQSRSPHEDFVDT